MRASLRDITLCLNSCSSKLYHAGFRGPIARSTLADANERRDCRTFDEFTLLLIALVRPLYCSESLAHALGQTVYAIDSSTVDLCLSLFAWAAAANARAGIKMHTMLDLRGNIPTFVLITGSLVHDATFLDHLHLEAGSFYVMDKAYTHFASLLKFTHAAAFFVVRPRGNLQYVPVLALAADWRFGVVRDEHIVLNGRHSTP